MSISETLGIAYLLYSCPGSASTDLVLLKGLAIFAGVSPFEVAFQACHRRSPWWGVCGGDLVFLLADLRCHFFVLFCFVLSVQQWLSMWMKWL